MSDASSEPGPDEFCPCGSMKVYRRCHGVPVLTNQPLTGKSDPHRFDAKGKKAERAVAELAATSFFADWCFPNPMWPHGAEVCDLLVQFGDRLLLWTIKDVRKNDRQQFPEKHAKKNRRQLADAADDLLDLRIPLTLSNVLRKPHRFDPTTVRRTILISVFMGTPPRGASPLFWEERGHLIHNMTGVSLTLLLQELDTISDFTKYLEAKEDLHREQVPVEIQGAEEEGLLAYYLDHGRSFQPLVTNRTPTIIGMNAWEEFQKSERHIFRKYRLRRSYFWDWMIESAHTMGIESYELVAEALARPNRHARMMLADALFGGAQKADQHWKTAKPGFIPAFHRVAQVDGRTYIFPFMDRGMSAAERRDHLQNYVCFARDRYSMDGTVLGVSTTVGPGQRQHDMSFLEAPTWDATDREAVTKWMEAMGIQGCPVEARGSDVEFEDPPKPPT